ncbi:filamentation induced by cAMP protein Fic [Candidatus Magnetobacterium bavaricum]|uniref:Filamentation induced by cAMP protein Fic n=1 Tax=Candidatus Magnetobacterium bavaricum TaxID=29290 RepID=A0A0F3GVR0_9BACT|nr:filamentation induced by cAMP protein Fic [Candidatus Magnetobacterium bavaricum]
MPVDYHYGKFPPFRLGLEKIVSLIGPANAAIARYDGVLSAIPNANVLLSPLTTHEAVLSSRIEGTQATMQEVLEFEAEGDTKRLSSDKKADINEIINYRKALNHAIDMLQKLPLCQRVICEIHGILMDNVRGHNKSPGIYRKVPNWIGPNGCSIEGATFVPISADKLPEAMSRWEEYVNDDKVIDRLVQLAVLHAEFEAMHPFLDGNGRIGRMLIPLFLYQAALLKQPMFYISDYLEANKDEYYGRLLAVSKDDDWTGWCVFFLKAVHAQAVKNDSKATAIIKLYNEMKKEFAELTHSQYAIHSLDWIFGRPIFKGSDFIKQSGIPKPTASRILNVLKDKNILSEIIQGSGRRSSTFAYTRLLNIAEGYDVFVSHV